MPDKAPCPIVQLQGSRLVPVSAYDAEALDGCAIGTQFDLKARTKRSKPQQGTYWKTLGEAVKATGRWETANALHTALKVKLGLVEPIYDLSGNVSGMQPHSTAFAKMNHQEFTAYCERAYATLSEALGYDCLDWMNQ